MSGIGSASSPCRICARSSRLSSCTRSSGALLSFDLIYGFTKGGPGYGTTVFNYLIYIEAFERLQSGRRVGDVDVDDHADSRDQRHIAACDQRRTETAMSAQEIRCLAAGAIGASFDRSC